MCQTCVRPFIILQIILTYSTCLPASSSQAEGRQMVEYTACSLIRYPHHAWFPLLFPNVNLYSTLVSCPPSSVTCTDMQKQVCELYPNMFCDRQKFDTTYIVIPNQRGNVSCLDEERMEKQDEFVIIDPTIRMWRSQQVRGEYFGGRGSLKCVNSSYWDGLSTFIGYDVASSWSNSVL